MNSLRAFLAFLCVTLTSTQFTSAGSSEQLQLAGRVSAQADIRTLIRDDKNVAVSATGNTPFFLQAQIFTTDVSGRQTLVREETRATAANISRAPASISTDLQVPPLGSSETLVITLSAP